MSDPRIIRRLRYSLWGLIIFLIGFAILISIVANYFLIPAFEVASEADQAGKRQLSASAALMLAVLLFILTMGIVLVMRLRRWFMPHFNETRQKTEYVDAWAEAGRRAQAEPPPPAPEEPR